MFKVIAWQTKHQKAGYPVKLYELFREAPCTDPPHDIDWYLKDAERIPEDWKEKWVFF